MAAPRGASYVAGPDSPFPGRVFRGRAGSSQAYNAYQKARAQALGYRSYAEQKKTQQSAAYRALITTERKAERFGKAGKLGSGDRARLANIFAQFRGQNTQDRSIGGPLDRYLRALGRRTGNETWAPGETPRMVKGGMS
jgi:hypothetical protein